MSRPAVWGLWVIVLLEILLPVPTIVAFGAAWVLLARPEGFFRLVCRLYDRDPGPPPPASAAPGGDP